MPRPRSLIRNMKVVTASSSHVCQNNADHIIAEGDQMLMITSAGNKQRYCQACARKFIARDSRRLQILSLALGGSSAIDERARVPDRPANQGPSSAGMLTDADVVQASRGAGIGGD